MKPALLLIDLQHDYLDSGPLHPSKGALCESASTLLKICRQAGIPVVHVWTTIRSLNERMPHWQQLDRHWCLEGSHGHATPTALLPQDGEAIIHKRFYSGFAGGDLETHLHSLAVDTLILAGLHLRACVRSTALDAYARGFAVWLASDAVADDDPVHAQITRRYLADRAVSFRTVEQIGEAVQPNPSQESTANHASPELPAITPPPAGVTPPETSHSNHVSPRDGARLWRVPISTAKHVAIASTRATAAQRSWSDTSPAHRAKVILTVAERLESQADSLARQMVVETGKPLRDARGEIAFGVDLLRSAVTSAQAVSCPEGSTWYCRSRPLGVVAIITPWNNPLAIPLGKIAPALLFGNTVVWKPAIPGASIAGRLLDLFAAGGLLPGALNVVQGDHSTAGHLMEDPRIGAVTLTGSLTAGYAAQLVCARRAIPVQAELGGNNAAIVWSDADLPSAAQAIASGGFGSAGQRCTANRRVIIAQSCHEDFVAQLRQAARELNFGDPLDAATHVGPVISRQAAQRMAATVHRAKQAGFDVFHEGGRECHDVSGRQADAYYPPTIICCPDPAAEIVQEETFGPVIVVQPAQDWQEAIALCNGVPQGLAAAVFTTSPERQQQFLAEARAGLLKINASTAGAVGDAPFGGWKASGVGPPEHGSWDAEFYTRPQAVYTDPTAFTKASE